MCDHSACSLELLERAKEYAKINHINLKIQDMPIFLFKNVTRYLKIGQKNQKIGIYAPCSTRHYAQNEDNQAAIIEIAKLCANEIKIHEDTKCCGFAGNKGFLNPSMNTHALKDFVKFYDKNRISAGFSSSSTCEIGLSGNTKIPWQHIIYLLDSCSHAKTSR